jgi:hypothetical protein
VHLVATDDAQYSGGAIYPTTPEIMACRPAHALKTTVETLGGSSAIAARLIESAMWRQGGEGLPARIDQWADL